MAKGRGRKARSAQPVARVNRRSGVKDRRAGHKVRRGRTVNAPKGW